MQWRPSQVLVPFDHQVAGQSSMLVYDETTLCKPLIPREHFVYQTLPPELSEFVPQYRGEIVVEMQEMEGCIQLVGRPMPVVETTANDRGQDTCLCSDDSSQASCNLEVTSTHDQKKQGNSPRCMIHKLHSENCKDEDVSEWLHTEGQSQKMPSSKASSCHVYTVSTSSADHTHHYVVRPRQQQHGVSPNPWSLKNHRRLLEKMKKSVHTKDKSRFMLLGNVVAGFRRPCILDLKIGSRLHGDDASSTKVASQTSKCQQTTSSSLGVRLCGMQVYQVTTKTYHSLDKYYGRTLTPETLLQTLRNFLHNGVHFRGELLQPIISRLAALISCVGQLSTYRFYASSLLIIYDGCDETHCTNVCSPVPCVQVSPIHQAKSNMMSLPSTLPVANAQPREVQDEQSETPQTVGDSSNFERVARCFTANPPHATDNENASVACASLAVGNLTYQQPNLSQNTQSVHEMSGNIEPLHPIAHNVDTSAQSLYSSECVPALAQVAENHSKSCRMNLDVQDEGCVNYGPRVGFSEEMLHDENPGEKTSDSMLAVSKESDTKPVDNNPIKHPHTTVDTDLHQNNCKDPNNATAISNSLLSKDMNNAKESLEAFFEKGKFVMSAATIGSYSSDVFSTHHFSKLDPNFYLKEQFSQQLANFHLGEKVGGKLSNFSKEQEVLKCLSRVDSEMLKNKAYNSPVKDSQVVTMCVPSNVSKEESKLDNSKDEDLAKAQSLQRISDHDGACLLTEKESQGGNTNICVDLPSKLLTIPKQNCEKVSSKPSKGDDLTSRQAAVAVQAGKREYSKKVDIRMIDFAHTTHAGFARDHVRHTGPDSDYIRGLEKLKSLFEQLQCDGCDIIP